MRRPDARVRAPLALKTPLAVGLRDTVTLLIGVIGATADRRHGNQAMFRDGRVSNRGCVKRGTQVGECATTLPLFLMRTREIASAKFLRLSVYRCKYVYCPCVITPM